MKKTPDIFAYRDKTLRVALCQVFTREWDVPGNLARVLESLDMAATTCADVAVLPECVFHGYGLSGTEDLRTRCLDIAENVDGPCLSAVRKKARELGMSVVVGFAEKGEGGVIYNAAAYITSEGVVGNLYRKVHCRDFESARHHGVFTPGDEFSTYTIQVQGNTFVAGTLICFDREIPESVRCLRALGAMVVFCLLACDTTSFQDKADYANNELVTVCRAAENEVFIVIVNHAGRFNGGSYVVGPGGELLHQMGAEPGVAVVDVPVGSIPAAFHSRPYGWMGWGFRRPEVYARYLAG